jgi:hypothetical protein
MWKQIQKLALYLPRPLDCCCLKRSFIALPQSACELHLVPDYEFQVDIEVVPHMRRLATGSTARQRIAVPLGSSNTFEALQLYRDNKCQFSYSIGCI